MDELVTMGVMIWLVATSVVSVLFFSDSTRDGRITGGAPIIIGEELYKCKQYESKGDIYVEKQKEVQK